MVSDEYDSGFTNIFDSSLHKYVTKDCVVQCKKDPKNQFNGILLKPR